MSAKSVKKQQQDLSLKTQQIAKEVEEPPLSQKPEVGPQEILPEVKSAEELEREEHERMISEYKTRMELLPLSSDLLKKGLSEIGPAPDSLNSVYHKFSLPYQSISDISGLVHYPYLFTVELQGNEITDLSPLSSMKYLVQLDVSGNKLKEFKFESPPFNLQDVNLSRNCLVAIDEMSDHRFLTRLALDDNQIFDLSSLSALHNLKVLTASGNQLTSIEPLRGLPLKTLDISRNSITSIGPVESLKCLESLNMNQNNVQDLTPLAEHQHLSYLDLSNNCIASKEMIQILDTLPMLVTLQMCNNPVEDLPLSTWIPKRHYPHHPTATYPPSYRLSVIFMVSHLTVFNSHPVTPEERVAAINCYNPPTEVLISIQHVNHQQLQAKIYARIKAEDLLRSKRLMPIVLCGPNGVGKRTLANRLLQEFPHIYGLSLSHTTRKPRPGEEHGVHYWFVDKSEMELMIQEGKFVELVTLFGNTYGTSMESIDRVTEQGKVCVMALEMEGVLALKKTALKARYILITAKDVDTLQQRLTTRHLQHSEPNPELQNWLERIKSEVKGEFDFTIVNDDLEQAYKELKEFCLKNYWQDYEQDE